MRTIRKISALSALLLVGGIAQAQPYTYTSAGTGSWTDPAKWTGNEPNGFPQAGDTVTIGNGHTITITGQQEALSVTVENGGVLKINGTGSPYASLKFPSSGSPVFSLAGANAVILEDNAEVIFQMSMAITDGGNSASLQGLDGDTCRLLINGVSAAATLTSNVLIHGALKINGTSGGNTETFANNLRVVADIPGEVMHLGDLLNTVSNGSDSCGTSAAWQANGSTGSGPYVRAQLRFNVAASGLGYFYVNQGELLVDRVSVSATGKTLTGSPVGIVTTSAGGSFSAPDCP